MIPKINLFEFLDVKNGATGGYEEGTVAFNLIAQSEEYFTPEKTPKKQKEKFDLQSELFDLMASIEFTIYSYGKLNFFIEYENHIRKLPRLIQLLDLYFEDKDIIEDALKGINQGIIFYNENEKDIIALRNYDENEILIESLENKIDFSFCLDQVMSEVYEMLLENPDDFCLDENNNSINPEYTGNLDVYSKIDGIRKTYTLTDGVFNGPATSYFEDNTKIESIRYRARDNYFTIKEWYENGLLKEECTNYDSKIDYLSERSPKEYKTWYESGNKKSERTENKSIHWYKNGQTMLQKENQITTYWDSDGIQISEESFFERKLY